MTTTTFGARLFARWYPRFMAGVDRAGQADMRHAQLAGARGRTLEIGAGNGLSVPHYPDDLDELILLEPNSALRTALADRDDKPAAPVTVVDGDAHALNYPDASFDTVTASLVFCSLRDPARALAEVHRVLRPGGSFLFHEHVRGTGARAVLQDLMTPVQRRVADGCHANRDFESLLRTADFDIEHLTHTRMPTLMPTIVPLVVGTAHRR
ncbi:class I SAM-dependent methyltransferase [Nocardia bovistercoris]|uniref:Methyltransferase domain-containing protein n=1 Tax=Nocardia bovistercoris TaxID=2785916 RepID=A0A931IEC8_9NOCA|nr:class I SAM-dependent methyltransferase [Nocardia bovistercoris]MBH0779919.1 methyltransferase domain-containing protein [Nocardia bovistercoris]